MAENQTDNNVIEIKCEEPSGQIINIYFYYLLSVTTLSAFLTVTVFLYTVIRAKETVERRRRQPSSTSTSEDNFSDLFRFDNQSDTDQDEIEPPSPRTVKENSSTDQSKSNQKNVTFKPDDEDDPDELYETKPKYYSREKIHMNFKAINEQRISVSSETSQQNQDVEALSQRIFARSKSDDVKKLAMMNNMMIGDGVKKNPWPKQDMRRRNSTWGGFEG